jgi:hypothetical protein
MLINFASAEYCFYFLFLRFSSEFVAVME